MACEQHDAMSKPGDSHDPAPHTVVKQMLLNGWVPQAISAITKYSIPDLLQAGAKSVPTLATETGLNAAALGRVMRALASVGLFQSEPDGTYTLTKLGEVLRADVRGSLRSYAIYVGLPARSMAFTALEHSLLNGTSAFEHVHGEEFYTYLAKHPADTAVFNNAMNEYVTSVVHAAVVESFSFADVNVLMDVGGGNGGLLASILNKHPGMHGILFDQPHVIAKAAVILEQQGLADRCRLEGGDFLVTLPHGAADAIIISRVIQDWDDARATRLLSNARAALPAGGRLFVCEHVIEDESEPWMDITMLVLMNGGRERTADEFSALYDAAGFELVAVHATTSPVSIVEGRAR